MQNVGDILGMNNQAAPQPQGNVPMPQVASVPPQQATDPMILRQAGKDILAIQAAGKQGAISREDALTGLQQVQQKYNLSPDDMMRLSQSAGKLTQAFPGLATPDQTGESKLSQFVKSNPRIPQLLLAAASSFSRAPESYNMSGRMVEGFKSGQEQGLMREKMQQDNELARMTLAEKLMGDPKYDVIENTATGEQKYITVGSQIPAGWKTVSKSSTNINVNTKVPESIRTATMDYKKGRALISQLQSMWDSVPHGSGIIGKVQGNVEKARASIGMNPKVKAYTDFSMGSIAPLVRSLGEKGNLSDTDIERAIRLIPSMTDTKEDAVEKFKALDEFMMKINQGLSESALMTLDSFEAGAAGPKVPMTAEDFLQQEGL